MLSPSTESRPTADDVARMLQPFSATTRIRELVQAVARKRGDATNTGWEFRTPADQVASPAPYTRRRIAQATTVFAAVLIVASILSWKFLGFEFGLGIGTSNTVGRESAVSELVASQFLSEIESLELTDSSIEVMTKEHRIAFRPGYEICVEALDGSTSSRSWDLLELKLKQPEAYAIFAVYAELFYQLQNGEIELFPMPDQSLAVDRVVMEGHRDADGWTCFHGWTPAGCARLWVSPTKLAYIQTSDTNGDRTESKIQPLDQLSSSTEFGDWVRMFVRE
jgi:hypothetical protein